MAAPKILAEVADAFVRAAVGICVGFLGLVIVTAPFSLVTLYIMIREMGAAPILATSVVLAVFTTTTVLLCHRYMCGEE